MLPRSPDFGLKIESSDAATAPSIVSLVPRGDRGVRPNRRKYGAAISQAPALPYNSGFLARGLPVRKRRVGRPPEGRRGASATKFRMLQPDYKEFARLAREATLVPVVKSVTADLLTPVSAYVHCQARAPLLPAGVHRTGRADRAIHLPGRAPVYAALVAGRPGHDSAR